MLTIEQENARAERIMAKPDPERIWLGPKCEEVGGDGRMWCTDPQDCQDCEMKAVEYVRVDIAKDGGYVP